MFLTEAEFAQIRPVRWGLATVGSKLVHTVMGEKDRRRFWTDFLKKVFINYFKAQSVTQKIAFDTLTPVCMTDDYELILPPALETIIYFARRDAPIKLWTFPPAWLPLSIALVLYLVIVLAYRNHHVSRLLGQRRTHNVGRPVPLVIGRRAQ